MTVCVSDTQTCNFIPTITFSQLAISIEEEIRILDLRFKIGLLHIFPLKAPLLFFPEYSRKKREIILEIDFSCGNAFFPQILNLSSFNRHVEIFTLQEFHTIDPISIKSYHKFGKQIIQQTQHTVLSSIFVQVPIATTVAVIVAFVDAQ